MRRLQTELMDDLQLLEEKQLIVDFDGVLTRLVVNWEALRTQLKQKFLMTHDTSLSEIFMFASDNGKKKYYLDVASSFESENLDLAEPSPLLNYIIERQIRFNICSNNTLATISRFMQKFSLLSLVEKVVAADDVRYLKPHSEGLLLIIGDQTKSNFLFIGDSVTDEQVAQSLQLEFVRYAFN